MSVDYVDPRDPFEISHGLVSYPFPLSDGGFGHLILPLRLTREDADRLAAFVFVLAQEAVDS